MSSNVDKCCGASYIANKQVLGAIFPKNGDYTPEDLRQMVMEVNRTEVEPNEFLSDNIYQFDSKTREVMMYSGTMEREKVQARTEVPKQIGKSR